MSRGWTTLTVVAACAGAPAPDSLLETRVTGQGSQLDEPRTEVAQLTTEVGALKDRLTTLEAAIGVDDRSDSGVGATDDSGSTGDSGDSGGDSGDSGVPAPGAGDSGALEALGARVSALEQEVGALDAIDGDLTMLAGRVADLEGASGALHWSKSSASSTALVSSDYIELSKVTLASTAPSDGVLLVQGQVSATAWSDPNGYRLVAAIRAIGATTDTEAPAASGTAASGGATHLSTAYPFSVSAGTTYSVLLKMRGVSTVNGAGSARSQTLSAVFLPN